MSLLIPESGLLFWMLLSFGIVFFVLAKYGFPVIVKMVEDRKSYIDDSLDAAKKAEEKMLQIQEHCETLLAEASKEQSVMLQEAAAAADGIVKAAQQKAKEEGERLMEEARKEIMKEREEALLEVRAHLAMLSVAVAEKILRTDLQREQQSQLVDRLIDDVISEKD